MHYYKIFGYTFRCEYEIRQLYEVPATPHYDAEIIIGDMPEDIMDEALHTDIELPYISCGTECFWMHNIYGILAVYKNGSIYAKSVSDKDTFYLLQFVLGYGIAMYAHLHNRITIHCGCVSIDDKCVIITGDSGAGKSTLTSELIDSGALMLSDDVVAIDYDDNHRPVVYPAFPQQKLCRDAAINKGYNLDELLYVDPEKDKFAVLHTDRFSPEPKPLHSVFYLKSHENTALRYKKLDGFNKISVIVNNLYLGCILPNVGLSAEAFQLCVDLVKDNDVHRIVRPTTRNTLSEIKAFIYRTISNRTREHCYIDIMNCILSGKAPLAETVRSISLRELYDFACLNKLVPLISKLLSYWAPSCDEETDLINEWKSEAVNLVFLEYKKLSLVKELLAAADREGITITLFKGYLLASLYPDFTLRNSSDTDILIEPRDLNKAQQLLSELHYIPASELDTENVYTYIYYEDDLAVHKIELHTSLLEDAKGWQAEYLNSLHLSAPDKNLRLECLGLNISTLNSKEHLIYQIFHMVKHLGCHGFPARYLLDTALFIRKYHEEIDWSKFHEIMRKLGYSVFCNRLFSILTDCFDVPKTILAPQGLCDKTKYASLLSDILHFGARCYEPALSDAFYYFETYIEWLEIKSGKRLDSITYDGTTVPKKRVSIEYQQNALLKKRIEMLRDLELI